MDDDDQEPLFPLNDETILTTFKEANFEHQGFTMQMDESISLLYSHGLCRGCS